MIDRLIGVIGTLAAVLGAVPAAAQDPTPAAVPARFSFRTDGQVIGAVVPVSPSETWLNPGNQVLRVPQTSWLAEVRVNAKVDAGSRLQFVLRPRVRGSVEVIRPDVAPTERGHDLRFEMTELFLDWRPTDALSVTYGLQNYQWGPAEMMGPSNRIFHEVGIFRDPLYVVRGKHIVRVNVSAGKQWSLVGMVEPGATDEIPFRAGAAFRAAGQAKLEYTIPSGATYLGVTAGARGGEPPWAGTYVSVALTDNVSTYIDASVQVGSQAWYPAETGSGGFAFVRNDRSGARRVLALGGLRYTFSPAFDARIEYLRQDAGYTRTQVTAESPLAVAQLQTRESVEQWLAPGLEFLGRDLMLVSVVARDQAPAGRLDVQGRYVRSLTDGSGAGFVTASLDVRNAWMLFGSLTLTHGPELAEFTRLARAGGVVGLIWSW